jgi:Holliday junction DNA helicase RuvA
MLLENDGQHVVIDVHGVGYGLDVPASTANALPAVGEEVTLHTYLEAKENMFALYGFATREEREVFTIFLGVSGIGPRTALSILSAVRIADFATAVMNNDVAWLTRIPGIGKKTAERLIVEVRDKMKAWVAEARLGVATPASAKRGNAEEALQAEVSAALQALGCKPAIADRAAARALELLGPKTPIEDLVREALRHRY